MTDSAQVLQQERAALVEEYLAKAFTQPEIPAQLAEAMRYSLLAGGKRLRPILCLSTALACAVSPAATESETDRTTCLRQVLPFAAALEIIHTYSLIHDDLPAMDDDDLRRGRPSCHKAFGEATAILAGDALLTDAFGFMAGTPLPANRVLSAIAVAADAAGAMGMVGGQILDLAAEGRQISREDLTRLNARKTGALLGAACECGAVLAGADAPRLNAVRRFGRELGIAFQVTDDVLDVVGDEATLGKRVGHDARHAKATWPALLGLEGAKALARDCCARAAVALNPALFSGPDADLLRHMARTVADRTF